MSRKMAEEWEMGTLFLRPPKEPLQFGAIRHEVFVKTIHRGQEWLVLQKDCAPRSCFKPEPEPAEPDGALEVGERVWVDCPKVPGLNDSLTGTGYITRVSGTSENFPSGCIKVKPAIRWLLGSGELDECVWNVHAAACHREGPQSEPPEGGVFLGRYGDHDYWRVKGGIRRQGGNRAYAAHEIDAPQQLGRLDWPWYISYRAALARARALGLVEAEPERVEPTFQMGQWYESHGNVFVCIDRTYSTQLKEWNYKGLLRGNPKAVLFSAERTMQPHAPVLAVEQEALRPGDVVESIKISVGRDGVPFPTSYKPLDGHKAIQQVILVESGRDTAHFASDLGRYLWNLRVVKKAEPD